MLYLEIAIRVSPKLSLAQASRSWGVRLPAQAREVVE